MEHKSVTYILFLFGLSCTGFIRISSAEKSDVLSGMSDDMKKQNGTTVESKTTTSAEKENISRALTETQLKAIQDNIQHVKDYLDRISEDLAAEKIVQTENTTVIENNSNNIDEKFDSLMQNFTSQLNQHDREMRDEMKDVKDVIKNIQNLQVTNTNLAKEKTADQSSTAGDGHAYRAVDGNRNGHFNDNSCTHTKREMNPWWRVDLAGSYAINRVVIKNRGDCCGERLQLLVVTVSDEKDDLEEICGFFVGPGANGGVYTITCDQPIPGRYVKLQIRSVNTSSHLTLCEVEIYPA